MIQIANIQKLSIGSWKLVRNMSTLLQSKAYIDGKWISSNETIDIRNPANGALIGTVPNLNVNDAEKAVESARKAFHSGHWKDLTAKQKSGLLKTWNSLIEKNRNEIAAIMTAESGKPIHESQGEVTYGNSFVEWFAEEARRINGEIIPSPLPDREILVTKAPIGVAVLITPWNFPLAMITRKAAAALAAGCTVVIKPSEETPLTALALVKLAEEAGFPAGVINVVTTNNASSMGDFFCKSNKVAGISFTGSTEVGKLLYKNCASGVKRIALELGGNAPFIVFNSANIEKAIEGAMASKFRNCGQTCVSANRFFVQEDIFNDFVGGLKMKVHSLKLGSGEDPTVQIGPLINVNQFEKVKSFVADAKDKNANILLGGNERKDIGDLFFEPTIVTDLSKDTKLYKEEVFGPVISIIKFKTEAEALEMANDTRRGLAGYFYSQDISQIFRVAKKLEVGMVGVNEGIISTTEAPFGGVKESGIGREGSHQGIDEYVDVKYICLGNLKYN